MESNQSNRTGTEQHSEPDIWAELGQQFQFLGESLAQAVRKSWENEENQRRLNEMRTGLENMVHQVDKAIRETASSPEGQRVRQEAERTAQTLRGAGEQAVQDVRPHLINALQNLNDQLQAFTRKMEDQPGSDPEERQA